MEKAPSKKVTEANVIHQECIFHMEIVCCIYLLQMTLILEINF